MSRVVFGAFVAIHFLFFCAGPAQAQGPSQISSISVHPKAEQDMEGSVCVDGSCNKKSLLPSDLTERISDFAQSSLSPVSSGIKRVMNTLYQRCDAYDISVGANYVNPSFYSDTLAEQAKAKNKLYTDYKGAPFKSGDLWARAESNKDFISYDVASSVGGHPYTLASYPPGCRDMRRTPAVFKEDYSRPLTEIKKGRVKVELFNSDRNHTNGKFNTLDCSGYVSSAYLAVGLRFYKTGPASRTVTTTDLNSFLKNPTNSCVKPVSFDAKTSLQPGDILLFDNGPYGRHSMVVDKVGADPFQLKDFPADKSCDTDLYIDDFQVWLTNSGSYGGRVAISKGRYQDIEDKASGGESEALFSLARAACEAHQSGAKVSASLGAISVLRHVGTSDPACYVHKPATHPDCDDPDSFACTQPWPAQLEGEECVQNCPQGDAS